MPSKKNRRFLPETIGTKDCIRLYTLVSKVTADVANEFKQTDEVIDRMRRDLVLVPQHLLRNRAASLEALQSLLRWKQWLSQVLPQRPVSASGTTSGSTTGSSIGPQSQATDSSTPAAPGPIGPDPDVSTDSDASQPKPETE